MRKTLSLILSIVMIVSMLSVGVFAAEGTPIKTTEDFNNMAADGNYYLAADITVDTTYEADFTGTLDGNGKTVTVSVPMFKQMNGTVKNLTTVGGVTQDTAKANLGAVAIGSAGGTFDGITNKATVDHILASGDACVGGICGRVGTAPATFINCVNEANVSGPEATGGIVGEAQKLDTTFDNCYNKGNITSSGAKSGVAAGGIIGYSGNDIITIKNCTNDGNITSGYRAGGIQGDARKSANVSNCVNNGTVKGGNISAGIVGYSGDDGIKSGTTIKNCINNGDVTGTGGGTGGAAGILGYAWASNSDPVKATTLENCINNGDLHLVTKGFVSEFVAYTNSQYTVIRNCIGAGKITATGDASGLFLCIVGMSGSDIALYTIENVFIADGGATTLLSWATADSNVKNRVPLSHALGKNLSGAVIDFEGNQRTIGDSNVKAITRGELNSTMIYQANSGAGSTLFALEGGKAVFAGAKVGYTAPTTPVEPPVTDPVDTKPAETDPVTPGTDPVDTKPADTDPVDTKPAETEPVTPPTGDNAYVVVIALAVVAIAGTACFFARKKVTD